MAFAHFGLDWWVIPQRSMFARDTILFWCCKESGTYIVRRNRHTVDQVERVKKYILTLGRDLNEYEGFATHIQSSQKITTSFILV